MIGISVASVIELHKVMAKETGGDGGLRDEALLDSAVNSAYQTFCGKELYPTVEEKAARVGFSLISNHPFVDGNKRIGMYVMLILLEVNGVIINPDQKEVVRVGLSLASSEMTYSDLISWIDCNKNS